ncbi:MAG: chemotaxis protein CheC [Armatimonadetes bacterium]|nr:chemotaxis protein CheC [Armatimonadota bacterium]MBS1710772.1 chemotaxis protein CheC [Armatimonadota bacterium]MBX3108443.1 chemotaxis protein CheC [Fimbriimonadaceae bacterium]
MSSEPRELGLMEMSAVREMANIGLGHATTALATVTGKAFNMEIPKVETVSLEQVPMMIGDPEEVTVGICMPFEGDIEGHTAFLFPWASAQDLWRMLIGTAPESPAEIDELAASAMLEIGNIVSSSFLNAISDMSGQKLHATPPMVSVDIAYTIAATIVAEAELEEAVALALETRLFGMDDSQTTGYFLCVPTVSGLNRLFGALGIPEAA